MTELGFFGGRVARHDGLVTQTRMGFSDPWRMLEGLRAVRNAGAGTVGTITLDSFTRTGNLDRAREELLRGTPLNGYPLLAHGAARTRELIGAFDQSRFPIQIRHGSPRPYMIFREMLAAGITATEGGPVSYCLPYSREPLAAAVTEWARSCELLSEYRGPGAPVHLESFSGCMLGQLCPPGLLVALNILEGLFFLEHGLRSISLSYAQQTNHRQDFGAITALRRLARERLAGADWHITIYTFMGVFPESALGARSLIEESARLAASTGSERLIVKTVAEAFRIPTIAENVQALRWATAAAAGAEPDDDDDAAEAVYREAGTLIDAVLDQHANIGQALIGAFRKGLLDVPYCLHPDNANQARTTIDSAGRLQWASTGRMPIATGRAGAEPRVSAADLLTMLDYHRRRFDGSHVQEKGHHHDDDRIAPAGHGSGQLDACR
ncbi:methylaspartate mutase [Nonomuraea sp. SYSU D8015]|uniref:methylaspartate mutase n=1 Tax=Nonomuraea sp. SYSU D8015 TaxID=2593644 RepID=UPI00166163BB|nr:methylaspartate mutase [Nonomuraea sp. SYSU D8015]